MKALPAVLSFVILTAVFFASTIVPEAETFRPVVRGKRGVVAAGHPLSAEAGMRLLQQGEGACVVGACLVGLPQGGDGVGAGGVVEIRPLPGVVDGGRVQPLLRRQASSRRCRCACADDVVEGACGEHDVAPGDETAQSWIHSKCAADILAPLMAGEPGLRDGGALAPQDFRLENDIIVPRNSIIYVPPTALAETSRFMSAVVRDILRFQGFSIGGGYNIQ